MRRLWILTLVPILALAAACDGAQNTEAESPGSEPQGGPFEVTLTTDRDAYAADQVVAFTVEVCNRGSRRTSEGWGGSDIPFDFVVRAQDGSVVADDSHVISTQELREVGWQAGQCRQAVATWDQHYWNRPEDEPTEPPDVFGLPVVGDRVPAGKYQIEIRVVETTVSTAVSIEA